MNRNSLYAVIFLLSSFQLFSQYAKENAQDLAFYLEDKHPVFTIGTDWTENLQGGKSISVGYIIEALNSTVDVNYVFYNFDKDANLKPSNYLISFPTSINAKFQIGATYNQFWLFENGGGIFSSISVNTARSQHLNFPKKFYHEMSLDSGYQLSPFKILSFRLGLGISIFQNVGHYHPLLTENFRYPTSKLDFEGSMIFKTLINI